jgi:hypothetical protein
MKRRFELSFDCDNAEFDPGLVAGIKRALKLVRWMVGNSGVLARGEATSRVVTDENGNAIGHWNFRVVPENMRMCGVLALWFGGAPLPKCWRFMFDQDKNAQSRFITNMEE